ncbi:ImmA/IrrE family metallo-endopeptidase [Streptomyces noursei]
MEASCQALLDTLPVPPSFDLETFLAGLAQQRGRPIKLQPWPGAGGSGAPCGLWFATETADYICYEPGTSPLHQEQIILHECAHILCDHRLGIDLSEAGRLLPDLGSSLIRRALARTSYTTRQEQEAEMLASLLSLRTTSPLRRHDGMLGRLTDSLGSPFHGGRA